MQASGGEIRASFLKACFEHGPEILGPELDARVHAQIPLAVKDGVHAAARTDWLPLEFVDAMNAPLWALAGEAATRAFLRDVSVRQQASPLFRPFVTGALSLFGLDPSRLASRFPATWQAVYRGCGELRVVERGVTSTRLVLEGCPPILLQERMAVANAGSFEAALVLCNRSGAARAEVDARAARVTFVLEWEPAQAAA